MNTQAWLAVAAIIIVAAIAIAVWLYSKQYRSRRLKERFGPEYDRAVTKLHDRKLAEAELQQREERVKLFHIVALSEADRSLYDEKWIAVQGHFVDDPKAAVEEAHQLILEAMDKRGYPSVDSEQAAADLSVQYPNLVTDYRAANRIAENNRRGVAKTEELRQALVHYRALFKELLEVRRSNVNRRDAVRENTRAGERSQPTHT